MGFEGEKSLQEVATRLIAHRNLSMATDSWKWQRCSEVVMRFLLGGCEADLLIFFVFAKTDDLACKRHGFDDKISLPVDVYDPSQTLERRWQIWRTWETRRRTGFACLLSEGMHPTRT